MQKHHVLEAAAGAVALLFFASVAFAAPNQSNPNQAKGPLLQIASSTAIERVAQLQKKEEVIAARISAIHDQTRQQHVAKISIQFNQLNAKWTTHFSELIDRYTAILQKIQDRASLATANGDSTTAAISAIQSAQTALTNAKTAVMTQASKDYTADLSSLPAVTATTTTAGQQQLIQTFQSAFQALRTTLFSDLMALRDGPMTSARQAVQNALQTLSQIPNINSLQATTTASTTTNQ